MPELDLMSKCREGDIWTYQSAMTNPNRIMHIIIIGTTKGSYSFAILGTKFEHLFRHITLVRKTDQSKTWNVKPAIYTDTNFENLLDFCGQIEKPVFDLIKSELSLSLINLYKKTVEIPYNINFIPTGRVFCDKETHDISEFSGRRIYRGLYRARNGRMLNADVNGALNILRKSNVVSLETLYSRGELSTPIRIRIA